MNIFDIINTYFIKNILWQLYEMYKNIETCSHVGRSLEFLLLKGIFLTAPNRIQICASSCYVNKLNAELFKEK